MAAARNMTAFLLLALIASAASAQGEGAPIRVSFAPGDGTRFVRTTVIEKRLVLEHRPDLEATVTQLRHDGVWRRTSRGHSLTLAPQRSLRRPRGLAAVMMQNDFVIHVRLDGTFLAISGVDRALDTFRKNMPPELSWMTEQQLSVVKQGLEQLWVDRFALAGLTREKPAHVGKVWGGPVQTPYGAMGTIAFTMGGRIFGWEEIDGRRCLVIETKAISEDAALGKLSGLLDQAVREMVALLPVSRTSQDGVADEISRQTANLRLRKITEESVRAIEPATYLTCKEQRTRLMDFDWLEAGAVRDAGTAAEIHTLTYRYF